MIALAVGLAIVTAALLVFPFWRRQDRTSSFQLDSAADQDRIDLELEREILLSSLAELEVDRVREKLPADDYERLKATDERRLLQVLEQLDALAAAEAPAPPPPTRAKPARSRIPHWAASLAILLVVIGGAAAIHMKLLGLEEARLAAAQRQMGAGMPDPREMVARLEARLRDNPNDLEGQVMAGRSYMVLDRIEEAKRAWAKVLELDPKNAEANFNWGVILLTTRKLDDPALFQEALDHFNVAFVKLPQEPALLWYRGIAFVHLRRYADADDSWTTAYQNLQPGSEDANFVRQALEQLRAGNPPLF
ncbi:MAG: hypothetical protein AB1515_08015 [Nitrospirota bacterium]